METVISPKERITKTAAELGLTLKSVFVPWSLSRSAGEKHPSLNWKVTLRRDERDVLTTDYGAGCGNCPAYKAMKPFQRDTLWGEQQIKHECETGKSTLGKFLILPDDGDVLHSLAMDASALDHSTFESWASDCGYDADSRKAEEIYRACLEIALRLRAAVGEDGLKKLQDACQDY